MRSNELLSSVAIALALPSGEGVKSLQYVVARVNGRDFDIKSIKTAYDGVLGEHLVIEVDDGLKV